MKLSIIVPVYNMAAEHKLEYCLDSLVAQTLADIEIIAVDDCSTDESWTILQEYEQRFPEMFHAVHSEENKHQGGAKNIGLRLAEGEWIGFIDSDDWITPDMYERLIRKAEETGADLVGCDYCLTDEHSMKVGQVVRNNRAEQTGILDDEKRRSLILDGGSLVVKIFRRSMILENDLWFPEHIFYEDNALGNSYLLLAEHFEYIEEPLYYYYQHDTSTVHTISEDRCEDRCKAGRLMLAEAERHDFLDKYRTELEYSFTQLFYVNTLFTYMAGVRRTKYRFVKALGEEMRRRFPDFQKNPYYLERTPEEEKKLIRMQMKSTFCFMAYYKLLWAYRNWRKRRKTLTDDGKQRVVGIRADANDIVATGHIMRCITIADALRRKGFRTVFFTADEEAGKMLSQAGMEQICLHTEWNHMEEEIPRLREMLSQAGVDILLVDSYQAVPAYFESLRDQVKLVCLDDCFDAVYPVDLLINYNAYHTRFSYKESYDARTRLLLGTAYVPLRREFAQTAEEVMLREEIVPQEEGRRSGEKSFSVLLASGGGDTEDALMGILEKAIEREALKDVAFHVIAGVYHPRGDELESFADVHANVQVYRPCRDMAGLMRKCDVAASAAGTMLYELSAMQVPTVFFQTADNQRYDGEFFADEERMIDAGDIRQDRDACLTAVCEGIERLLGDEALRARMRERLSLVTDGMGADRIAEEIAKL